MQLREINIESFGVLRNRRVTGLSPGINLIHGPNEFGKTTVLDFIRRILFGFPDRRFKGNLYHALDDSPHGGSLVCQLANSKTITVSREEGPDGGPVEIVIGNQEVASGKELYRILGGIGGTFYQNVYAIDLDELGRKESLEEGEVENHIYGAGLGLEPGILAEIRREFKKQAEDIFKSGGSAQEIPKLYRNIADLEKEIRQTRADLTKYDELVNKRDEMMKAVDLLAGQIRELEDNKRILENQRNLFQTYVELKDAENKLTKLEELPLFTDDAQAELDKHKKKIEDLNELIEDNTKELQQLESERDTIIYDERIIEKESDITSLQRNSEKYISASGQIGGVEQEKDMLKERIQSRMERLGQGWTRDSIRAFNLSILQEDKITQAKENLSEASERVKRADTKLDLYRDRKRQESSGRSAAPAPLMYALYVIAALGLIGAVVGFIATQTWLAIIPTAVFVICIGIIISTLVSKRPALPDKQEQEYKKELSEAEKSFEELHEEWSTLLASVHLGKDLSPDAADQAIDEINGIKSNLDLLEREEKRIEQMRDTIVTIRELHDKVLPCFPESRDSGDVATNIHIFNQALSETKEKETREKGIEDQIRQAGIKIDGMKQKKRLAEEELQRYIASKGASDEDDFRHKYEIFLESQGLKSTIDQSKKTIQSTVGMGEHYDRFIQSISSTTPDQLESELADIKQRLEELKKQHEEANQEIGKKISEIDRLSSSEDLLVKQTSLEIAKQQLRDYSVAWAKAQIGLFVLEKAIREYESTMQPEVIKVAQDIFANITDHAYSTIMIPVGTKDFTILDRSRKTKIVRDMSRGTKEQLYFAMRLGLIKIYEDEKEPMPIIMDDILVNFDDARGPLAIKELAEFARDRQVIILTCHENTLDLYKRLGAKEITFK